MLKAPLTRAFRVARRSPRPRPTLTAILALSLFPLARPAPAGLPVAEPTRDAARSAEPAATLFDDAVRRLGLERHAGRVILVDFWASWCAPCLESFPWMAHMLERYGDRGLVIVAVNLDEDPEAARAFLDRHGAGFEQVSDPEGLLPEAFGVQTMPTSILFDRKGRPIYRHEGFVADRTDHYERHILALLDARGDTGFRPLDLRGNGRSTGGVRPWEKGRLARQDMRLDADFLDLAIDDHIYFSKEASSGGRGFGGGGCGCN